MASFTKPLLAALIGFAVGAGAVSGGVATYMHLEPQAVTGGSHASPGYATVVDNTNQTLPLGPDTISNVVKQVGPAVVKITAEVPQTQGYGSYFNQYFGSIFGGQPQQQYTTDIGSGFFFNSKGDILTNDHVINGATKISVTVPGYSQAFPATVVGDDYATDLAVIKINAPKAVPYLALGNSNTTPVGAWTIAIGNPYDLSHTVTVGVISAKGRPLTIGSRNYTNLLQTSAAINPGNSGGPLLNLAGQVIGINTAVAQQAQGIGFAIPTSTVQTILPQLMTQHHVTRPWIGVFILNNSATVAGQYSLPISTGVVIASVSPGGPAANAGLQSGDIITQVNGKPVANATALQKLVAATTIGQHLSITVNRSGKTVTRTVTVGQEPNQAITPPATSSSLGG